jgi:hypothetical protein
VVGVVGITANIEVEMLDLPGLLEAAPHVGDALADAGDVFVEHGDDDGRGGEGNGVLPGAPGSAHEMMRIAAAQAVEKAEDGEDEADGDLAEEERKHRHADIVLPEKLLPGIALEHEHEAGRGEEDGESKEYRAPNHEIVRVRSGGGSRSRRAHRIWDNHQ